ncbi:MAG: chromate transporter [Candidatus Cloacimonetes bacterium]|nr:chromate transporter [Candidatus Cloacimonadota bacterium]
MKKPSLLTIFVSFFKIGLFTIGGGYAMLPLIHRDVVDKHRWMDEETFMDGISAAQSCPGAIAVNLSIYTGYHIAGGTGLVLAVLGSILPSFIIILLIALSFSNWSQLEIVQKAFAGLRPAVTALIAVPVIQIAQKSKVKWHAYWLAITALILIVGFHVSPVYMVLFTILLSWIKYLAKSIRAQKKEDKCSGNC